MIIFGEFNASLPWRLAPNHSTCGNRVKTNYTAQNIDDLKFEPDCTIEECAFQGIDFTQRLLKSVAFLDCTFTDCNFANVKLVNVAMNDVHFNGCNLIGVNWCALKRLANISFSQSKLDFCSFQNLKLKRLKLQNCSVRDADFTGADLSSADFSESIFAGSTFHKAGLSGADFRTSQSYFIDPKTTNVKGAKFSYPGVLALITALGAEVDF